MIHHTIVPSQTKASLKAQQGPRELRACQAGASVRALWALVSGDRPYSQAPLLNAPWVGGSPTLSPRLLVCQLGIKVALASQGCCEAGMHSKGPLHRGLDEQDQLYQ